MKKPIFRSRKLPKNYRRVAKDAVTFVLNKHCPRMVDRMQVEICMTDLNKEKIWADVDYKSLDPQFREFLIRVHNRMTPHQFIRTLMHELVHVKQYAKNEMKYYERDVENIKWKVKKININKTDYWDFPWEVEAHGREEGLTQQFMRAYPEHKPFCRTKRFATVRPHKSEKRRPSFIKKRKV